MTLSLRMFEAVDLLGRVCANANRRKSISVDGKDGARGKAGNRLSGEILRGIDYRPTTTVDKLRCSIPTVPMEKQYKGKVDMNLDRITDQRFMMLLSPSHVHMILINK